MRRWKGYNMAGICVLVIAAIFFGDLWIKNHIENTVAEGETIQVQGGRFLIRRHHNRGAMLNAGQSISRGVALLSVLLTAAAAIAFVLSLGKRGNHLLRMGLALLLGGAFSNTYDRLKRRYVVDYLSFGVKWKKFRGIVFNISDFCIMIGALTAALGAGR